VAAAGVNEINRAGKWFSLICAGETTSNKTMPDLKKEVTNGKDMYSS
jgi:hypothetical protein